MAGERETTPPTSRELGRYSCRAFGFAGREVAYEFCEQSEPVEVGVTEGWREVEALFQAFTRRRIEEARRG